MVSENYLNFLFQKRVECFDCFECKEDNDRHWSEQNVYSIKLARKLLKDRLLTNYSKGEQTVLCTIYITRFYNFAHLNE